MGLAQLIKTWLSTLKWIILSLSAFVRTVEFPVRLGFNILTRDFLRPWVLRLRDGLTLQIPENYLFQSIAECILLNAYHFLPSSAEVVIDVGASIGDFATFAAKDRNREVYAFEADDSLRSILASNVKRNRLENVRVHPEAATPANINHLLASLHPDKAVFLKLDCEGCEYEILPELADESCQRIREVHLEVHRNRQDMTPLTLMRLLSKRHYSCRLSHLGGQLYLHAVRVKSDTAVPLLVRQRPVSPVGIPSGLDRR